MKTQFTMTLFDNKKNRRKASMMTALEIMFDDVYNPLPDTYYNSFDCWVGEGLHWGDKVKITIEKVED